MNVLLDIILVLIFLLIVVISTCRGFVKCIWSMVTVVGAFILAYNFGPRLGSEICDRYIYDYVSSYTYASVEEMVVESNDNYDVSGLFDNVPQEFVDLLEHCGVELDEVASTVSPSMTVSQEELYEIAGSIAMPISVTISNIIGIIVVFFASILLISIFGIFMRIVVKVPVIRFINSFFGMLLGAVEGFVIVWVICLLIGLIVEHGFIGEINNEFVYSMTDGSYLLKFFCQLSPIDFINIRIE